jgi:flagellar motility protein MotE (MotC chaperone)
MSERVKTWWQWGLPFALALAGAIAGGLGAPTCADLQTQARAAEQHQALRERLESDRIHNEGDHKRIFDELAAQRQQIVKALSDLAAQQRGKK